MFGKRLPGQTNIFALLMSGAWASAALLVIIIGHLVWVFIAYGIITESDALKELEVFLPMLSQTNMYILAGLAVIADIWIVISSKKERDNAKNKNK